MNPLTQAYLIMIVAGAAAGILTDLLIRGVMLLWNKTRPWGLLLDEEGGVDRLAPLKMVDGHLVDGKGPKEKRYPVKAEARRVTNKGALYIIGRQSGVNLTVPTKDDIAQTLAAKERPFFDVCDPGLLARVLKNRTTQETLEGQTTEDSWKKSAVPWVAGLAGVVVIVLGIVAGVAVGGA